MKYNFEAPVSNISLLYLFGIDAGFKLTYCDSGNMIHFSIFTMQVFPLSQKITIPEYNAVSQSKTDSFFLLLLKTISICHVLANRGHVCITYSKS